MESEEKVNFTQATVSPSVRVNVFLKFGSEVVLYIKVLK